MSCTTDIDCDAGRRLGCRTFCCHLLIRLEPDERLAGGNETGGGFVEKDTDGCCIHLDKQTHLCRVWEQRPRVCRSYHCNDDLLLQVVLRHGFAGLANLARAAAVAYIPRETFVRVPERKQDS